MITFSFWKPLPNLVLALIHLSETNPHPISGGEHGWKGVTLPIWQPPILSSDIKKVIWLGANSIASLWKHTKSTRESASHRKGRLCMCRSYTGSSQGTHGGGGMSRTPGGESADQVWVLPDSFPVVYLPWISAASLLNQGHALLISQDCFDGQTGS